MDGYAFYFIKTKTIDSNKRGCYNKDNKNSRKGMWC